MIIQEGKVLSDKDSKVNKISTKTSDVYFKGLIFTSGKKCGPESIDFIVNTLLEKENPNFNDIFGNYFICVVDRENHSQHIFIDNSGIFKAYKYKNCISTSFLELVDFFQEITLDKLKPSSIVEFFQFGFPYFENTLIEDIKRIGGNELYAFQDGRLMVKSKNIREISNPGEITMKDFFADLSYAVQDKMMSLDLTGGFDSRLILSFFVKERASFEIAISGKANHTDVLIPRIIAKKINRNFFPAYHETNKLSAAELKDIFNSTDSQIDIIEYHRNHQLNYNRLSRNIDLQISGVGGELYKDFWWLQDFPFYKRKKTNLEKLYKYRIQSISFPHEIIGNRLKSYSLNLKQNTLQKLKFYVQKINTQSYDNIYYQYKMKTNAGVYISCANNYFLSYAPLLEPELVRIGYGLKRSQRFFNRFHRKMITQNCPEISTVRTTEGVTSSSSPFFLITDIIFYIIDKSKRALKQILRKILNKTYFQDSATNQNIYSLGKASEVFEKYVELLKSMDYLNSEIELAQIPDKMVGKILTLGLLIERLQKKS